MSIHLNDMSKLFKYVHLSVGLLKNSKEIRDGKGNKNTDSFVFSPRSPSNVFRDSNDIEIEDNFTKRISVATDIRNALKAIDDQIPYQVYVVEQSREFEPESILDLEEHLDKVCSSNLNYKKRDESGLDLETSQLKRYAIEDGSTKGYEWLFKEFLIESGLPINTTVRDLKSLFYGCVPDAHYTREEWLLADTLFHHIGIWDPRFPNRVFLNSSGKKLVSSLSSSLWSKVRYRLLPF